LFLGACNADAAFRDAGYGLDSNAGRRLIKQP
jgi:hypothetical protein